MNKKQYDEDEWIQQTSQRESYGEVYWLGHKTISQALMDDCKQK